MKMGKNARCWPEVDRRLSGATSAKQTFVQALRSGVSRPEAAAPARCAGRGRNLANELESLGGRTLQPNIGALDRQALAIGCF